MAFRSVAPITVQNHATQRIFAPFIESWLSSSFTDTLIPVFSVTVHETRHCEFNHEIQNIEKNLS